MTRTIFITGVSSGMGHSLSKICLSQGFEVYGISRREPSGLLSNPHFHFEPLDLSESEKIEPVLSKLFSGLETLQLAVLNAAILGPIADLYDTPISEIHRVMNINVWANKIIIDSLYKLHISVQQVVAISSGASSSANRGWNAYAISKAALNMLTALYATERPETHFSALSPGIVDTPMQDQLASLPEDPRFTSLDLLRDAKGTPLMPPPDSAAERLLTAFEKALKHPTGSYLDINTLVKRSWL